MPALRPHRAGLRARIAVSIAAMLVPLVALGGAGAVVNDRATAATAATVARVIADVGAINQLGEDLDTAERAGEELAATGDASAQRRFIDAGRGIERTLDELRHWSDADERAFAPALLWDWRRAKAAVPAAHAGGAEPVDRASRARFTWAMSRAHERLGDLHALELRKIDERHDALQDAQRRQLELLGLLLAAAALAVPVLGGFLYRAVSVPLAEVESAAAALGRGELGHRARVSGAPELEAVATAFNAMADQLAEGRQRLAHQAHHDPLTGLGNRRLFLERTAAARDRPAVLFIDLDDFKAVNDSLGHGAGDAMLGEIAGRLRDAVRPGDLVARLGGDEFAVLLDSGAGPEEAERVADRLRLALAAPVDVLGHRLQVRASIGIAAGDEDAATLLRNADIAMYEAKAAGKDARRTYEPAMHDRVAARLELESRLHAALDGGEFEVHYQPIVDLGGGTPAFEALVRWRHPDRGLVPPGDFIPAAERSGLIVELGSWVLGQACAFGARVAGRAGIPALVSVNLSPRQLEAPGLVDDVRRRLEESGLPPERLILEITETTVARDLGASSAVLTALRALGVRIAIDDFGTGYSSLGILHRLPVDILKIDRSFVAGVDGTPRDRSLVEAILTLADALGTTTVAEGVERETQAEALRALGCRRAQGFHFARPLAHDDAIAYLCAHAGRAAAALPPA